MAENKIDDISEVKEATNKNESFRDKVATIDESGKRVWIYPRKPSGPFYRARTIVSILLLAFLFGAPFIKVNGHPFLLFNILERKFIVFGLAFWPQDLHLFALAVLTLVVFIILFTAVFGRVFCGWICPQTVFLEMVFRKIEYLIEGDAPKQRALKKAPWNWEKIWKKTTKHAIFYGISFLIGNTFLAYIIGIDQLFDIITDPPSQHLGGLTAMLIFSAIFYGVFAFFREQACVMVCPYGRLQGVLLDPNSIVVMYDFKRGEPRGKIRKNQPRDSLGDCIDCNLCVQVCPTGIDIRNGTQLECVNCTACIDACNTVMTKIGKPKGLIRYSSYNAIVEETKKLITPRVIGYSVILMVLLTALVTLLLNRAPVETTILRIPGQLYQKLDNGDIQNLYNVKVINKSFESKDIHFKLKNLPGTIQLVSGESLHILEDDLAESALFIRIPQSELTGVKTPIQIQVFNGDELLEEVKTYFVGPEK